MPLYETVRKNDQNGNINKKSIEREYSRMRSEDEQT